MIIRSIKEIEGTDRETRTPKWISRRLLLAKDGMGFSFHMTTLYAGQENQMWYKNHLESVFCVEGEAELEDLATGEKHRITPGVMYALDQHDKHILRIIEDFTALCVFNPPCTGQEVHDKDGAYPLLTE